MKLLPAKFLALAAVIALSACSSVNVTTNYDHTAKFGKFHTYTLAPAPHGQKLSPATEDVLRSAIRTQLAARGITEAMSGKGDLAIVWRVFSDDKTSVRESTGWQAGTGFGSGYPGGFDGGWPYAYGSYGMWEGAPASYMNVKSYTQGTLIIDVVDTHTGKVVFRGTATAVVKGPRTNAREIEGAVEKMVAALPTKR